MRRGRCCCGKRCYTKAYSLELAVKLKKRDGVVWNHYKCPFQSRIWHIGHPNPNYSGIKSREIQRDAVKRKVSI